MDYQIRRTKDDLDSTGYMEIGPGKYSGKHWQNGFAFVWEDAFGMAEGIVMQHFPAYDHFGMNDIPKELGNRIIQEWRTAAEKLPKSDSAAIQSMLNLDQVYRKYMDDEILEYKHEIAAMLTGLSDCLEQFLKAESWVCILGV